MAENLKSKYLYKIELSLIKVVPMIMAFLCLMNSILSYFCIDLGLFSYVGGVSLLTLLILYVSSYVFRFCKYHRMFIHYTALTWLINLIDYNIDIPIDDLKYLCLQMIVAGIFTFLIIFSYAKDYKRIAVENNK